MLNDFREMTCEMVNEAAQLRNVEFSKRASDTMIEQFELEFGIHLPDAFRNWLQSVNGVNIGPGGLLGIQQERDFLSIEAMLRRRPEWQELGYVPAASDGCGNYYVVATAGAFCLDEPVLFIEPIQNVSTPQFLCASDVWHCVHGLIDRELHNVGWPFDETYACRMDPDLRRALKTKLPWHPRVKCRFQMSASEDVGLDIDAVILEIRKQLPVKIVAEDYFEFLSKGQDAMKNLASARGKTVDVVGLFGNMSRKREEFGSGKQVHITIGDEAALIGCICTKRVELSCVAAMTPEFELQTRKLQELLEHLYQNIVTLKTSAV